MTTRKRNDESGHVRGEGDYSSSHPKLDRRDHFLRSVSSVAPGHTDAPDLRRGAEDNIEEGSGNGGFASKLPKK